MKTKKKKSIMATSIMAFAGLLGYCAFYTYDYNQNKAHESDLLLENIEALASDGESGGTNISGCLGLWGSCTLPNGTVSKAPAVEVGL